MSVVDELKDRCFVVASQSLHELIATFEEEVGRKPSLAELCEVLTWGMRTCAGDLLSETPNQGIVIVGKATVAKQRMNVGDLIGVPVGHGGMCAALLYLGKFGRFGHAFGIFGGLYRPSAMNTAWQPRNARHYPIFTDDQNVASGRWLVTANRKDLLSLFAAPAWFHHPDDDPGDGSYGRYGLAESASGELRPLTAEESKAVFEGIPPKSRHVFMPEDLERYLAERSQAVN